MQAAWNTVTARWVGGWALLLAAFAALQFGTTRLDPHPWLGGLGLGLLWLGLSLILGRAVRGYRRSCWRCLGLFAGGLAWTVLLGMMLLKLYWASLERDFQVLHRPVVLTTTDGTALQAYHLDHSHPRALLLLHGLGSHPTSRYVRGLAESLSARYDVLLIALRGHRGSGGQVDDNVWQDARAGLQYLRAQSYRRIDGVGISLGAIALAQAVGRGEPVDGLILISSVARPETLAHTRALHASLVGRAALRLKGVRIGDRSGSLEAPGIALARDPPPLLVVHGDRDPLFPIGEARAFAALGDHVTVRVFRGGHGGWLLRGQGWRIERAMVEWLDREATMGGGRGE